MANISDAVGTISFDPDFYQKHKNIIDAFIQEMINSNGLIAEYGIMLNSQTEEEIEFTGSGRWSLSNILPAILVPISYYDQQKVQSFEDFYDLMKKTKATIEIEYQDYEAGAEFLIHEIAILKVNPTPTKENISNCELFNAEVTTSDSYDYNDNNKIDLGFEEGYLLNDPRQKDQFIKQEFHPWYEEQDDEFKNEHPYSKLKNDVLKYIKTDLYFENGICSWRCEDGFQDIVDDL